MTRIVAFLLVFLVANTFAETKQNTPLASAYARTTSTGFGAVASVNPLATQVGIDIFRQGGNAIDAALAVAFTLGVVDSHNSGIGGGCFILAHLADGTILAIDGREMAPALAHSDMFIKDGAAVSELSKTGALAVGIPGSVAALHYLQKRAGIMDFKQVIYPAALIAEQGFAIDAVLAKRLQSTAQKLAQFPASASLFLTATEQALAEGDMLIQSDLATTYKKLAAQGPEYFYRGEFARAVDLWMQDNGGLVRADDFANYQMELRTPLRSEFFGHTLVGFPPPSSGGVVVAQTLNILKNFELKTMDTTTRYHVIIEAMKLAFADRAHWLGDPDFVKVPRGLIGDAYARTLAQRISLDRASTVESHAVPPEAEEAVFGKHTTHIATADKEGNWVAITTTLNTSFGSKVVVPGTGVLLNNQMDDFVAQVGVPNAFGLVGSSANQVAARKRPLSSMSPTLVLKEGKPVLTLGAAGGPTIITQVLQVILNTLALDMDLNQAMSAVRVHHQWRPDMVLIDPFATLELKSGLQAKGQSFRDWPPFGATQAIGLYGSTLIPVTEPRLAATQR